MCIFAYNFHRLNNRNSFNKIRQLKANKENLLKHRNKRIKEVGNDYC